MTKYKEELTEGEAAWKALGITNMVDANGLTLAEHISKLKAKLKRWLDRNEDLIEQLETKDDDWKEVAYNLRLEIAKLKNQLEQAMSQNYCTICGNTLDGYKPKKDT